MKNLMTFALAGLLLVFGGTVNADELYQSDFGSLMDGELTGQDGWDAQSLWTVSSGVVSNSGSWQRAIQQDALFTAQPGDVVRMISSLM